MIARCDLTVDGTIRSKGNDAGADLIHLEGGCHVVINGLVESTGGGHGIPNNPPNHCYGPDRQSLPAGQAAELDGVHRGLGR